MSNSATASILKSQLALLNFLYQVTMEPTFQIFYPARSCYCSGGCINRCVCVHVSVCVCIYMYICKY